jgi:hypothetical protein
MARRSVQLIFQPEPPAAPSGPLNSPGGGHHDLPYRFGRRPSIAALYPFSIRQYARLLVLCSQVQSGLVGADDLGAESLAHQPPEVISA